MTSLLLAAPLQVPPCALWEWDSMANWLLLAPLLDVCKSACPRLRSHLYRTIPLSAASYSYPGRDVTKVTHPGGAQQAQTPS